MGPFDLVTNDPALRRGDQAGEFVEQGRRGLQGSGGRHDGTGGVGQRVGVGLPGPGARGVFGHQVGLVDAGGAQGVDLGIQVLVSRRDPGVPPGCHEWAS